MRIIGGQWRGTKLPVADLDGLRPTTDRVRETVFNWLQGQLQGAIVADLFAGSGALGIEAVSRGAKLAYLVEKDRAAAQTLRQVQDKLDAATQLQIVNGDAAMWLRQTDAVVDVFFVDPPFAMGLHASVMPLLERVSRVGSWLYLECPRNETIAVADFWQKHREDETREVHYALYQRV